MILFLCVIFKSPHPPSNPISHPKHPASQYPIKYHRPRNGKILHPIPNTWPSECVNIGTKKFLIKLKIIYNYKIYIDISLYFISNIYFYILIDNLQKLSANTMNLKSFFFPLTHNTPHLPTSNHL